MTKVLLTGFVPFGKATLNPSGEIVKQISGDNIVTAILLVTHEHRFEEAWKCPSDRGDLK
jgi:pyrrolidone-carboxylate peptidase